MADRLEQLLRLHAADPDDADVPYMIALEHGKTGNPADAITWFDKTIALDPDYHYAYYQKAKMLVQTGQNAAAADTIRQGIARATAANDTKAASELNDLLVAIE